MTNPSNLVDDRPIFTAVVDKFVEFADKVECDSSGWRPVTTPAGPADQILSVRVDELLEFNDAATSPASSNGAPDAKRASQTDPAA